MTPEQEKIFEEWHSKAGFKSPYDSMLKSTYRECWQSALASQPAPSKTFDAWWDSHPAERLAFQTRGDAMLLWQAASQPAQEVVEALEDIIELIGDVESKTNPLNDLSRIRVIAKKALAATTADAPNLRDILDKIHHAIGESEVSDDESLPDTIAKIIEDYKRTIARYEITADASKAGDCSGTLRRASTEEIKQWAKRDARVLQSTTPTLADQCLGKQRSSTQEESDALQEHCEKELARKTPYSHNFNCDCVFSSHIKYALAGEYNIIEYDINQMNWWAKKDCPSCGGTGIKPKIDSRCEKELATVDAPEERGCKTCRKGDELSATVKPIHCNGISNWESKKQFLKDVSDDTYHGHEVFQEMKEQSKKVADAMNADAPEKAAPSDIIQVAIDALETAHSHIVSNHASSVMQKGGVFCPVCHHEDYTEPEMDKIVNALHKLHTTALRTPSQRLPDNVVELLGMVSAWIMHDSATSQNPDVVNRWMLFENKMKAIQAAPRVPDKTKEEDDGADHPVNCRCPTCNSNEETHY